MRVLKAGERKARCPKCNTIFAYTENDLSIEYKQKHSVLGVYEYKYVVCPICRAKLIENERLADY